MRLTVLSLFAATTLGAMPALADEVWNSNIGEIAWEESLGDDAVLRLGDGDGLMRMIVPGLARDTMGGRGAYTGMWIAAEGDVACATQMVDPLGSKSEFWGTFTITFVNDGFPSDFAGVYGLCLDSPTMPIQAHAR